MPARHDAAPFGDVISLQRSIGNAAVSHLLGAKERASGEVATPVSPGTQSLIAAQTGGGEAMSASLQSEMAGLVGGPVGGARIHRGPESDALTRLLGATGLAQGRDVFLRSDRDPASDKGRATLAHELTHVAQGSAGPGAVMREPAPDLAEPMGGGTATKEQARVPGVVAKITLDGGDVDGGSRVPGHEGEVEFDSISAAISNPGAGTAKGESKPTELLGMKLVDKASPVLSKAVVDGEHVISARFQFIKRGDDGTVQDLFSREFSDGIISNYIMNSGGEAPSESMTFSFGK